VGEVGEEGIELQEQCRYIIHYDLQWNRLGWSNARVVSTGLGGDALKKGISISLSC
jgi:hypothetical protein